MVSDCTQAYDACALHPCVHIHAPPCWPCLSQAALRRWGPFCVDSSLVNHAHAQPAAIYLWLSASIGSEKKQLPSLDQWRQRLLGCNRVDGYWFKCERRLNGIWIFFLRDETVIGGAGCVSKTQSPKGWIQFCTQDIITSY